ncbi:MAG TPA: hypothetical protein VMW91_00145 [Desulfosporosinus sp.]|nr:hypothetical protein [Desulfosporosinus sp.]
MIHDEKMIKIPLQAAAMDDEIKYKQKIGRVRILCSEILELESKISSEAEELQKLELELLNKKEALNNMLR